MCIQADEIEFAHLVDECCRLHERIVADGSPVLRATSVFLLRMLAHEIAERLDGDERDLAFAQVIFARQASPGIVTLF